MKFFVWFLVFLASRVSADDPWTDTTTPYETTIIEHDCGTTCQNIDNCELIVNYETCECTYNCASATETETTEDCTSPCPESPSSFCSYMRVGSCTCDLVCCAPPLCEGSSVDWANCLSCGHCPCLPVTSTEPETISTPYCEDGWVPDWDNCSVDSCPCIPDTTTETGTETTAEECTPCPLIPSSYCHYQQTETCTCDLICCAPPQCEEGFTVDWATCIPCQNCTCIPIDTTTSPADTTTTTQRYCGSTCEFKEGCVTSRNMQTCECLYDCPTPAPTKKLKCFAI